MKFEVLINSGMISKQILSKIYAMLLNIGNMEDNNRYKWGKDFRGKLTKMDGKTHTDTFGLFQLTWQFGKAFTK